MVRYLHHRGNGLARIMLAMLLILFGVAFKVVEPETPSDPRFMRLDNHRLSGCSREQLGSFVTRLACADPLDKRQPQPTSRTIRVED